MKAQLSAYRHENRQSTSVTPESTTMISHHTSIPGHHIGPLPTDEQTLTSIRTMHARGYNTILACTWQELQSAGIEPDDLTDIGSLA